MKVKKTIIIALIAVTVIIQMSFINAEATTSNLALDDSVRLNDVVITLLIPQITSAVERFYEPYLTIKPTVATYFDTKIVQIQGGERIHEGIYNSRYTVAVEVFPYVGPHLAVGKDRITFNIESNGINIESYEHIKSYPLPPNDQSLIKKSLP